MKTAPCTDLRGAENCRILSSGEFWNRLGKAGTTAQNRQWWWAGPKAVAGVRQCVASGIGGTAMKLLRRLLVGLLALVVIAVIGVVV